MVTVANLILFVWWFIAPTITPSREVIHYVGEYTAVTCTSANAFTTVYWWINDVQYNNTQPGIQVISHPAVAIIVIHNIPQEYNNSAVKCEVSYSNGQSFSSDEVRILLQGKKYQKLHKL